MHAEEEEFLVKPFGCACQGRQHYNEITQLYIFLVSQHKTTVSFQLTCVTYTYTQGHEVGVFKIQSIQLNLFDPSNSIRINLICGLNMD